MNYKFKSGNHLFNYCRKVVYNKDFEMVLDEQKLLNDCILLYDFTMKNLEKISEKCFKKPTNIFSYTIAEIDNKEDLIKCLENTNKLITNFEMLFDMPIQDICKDAALYDVFIDKISLSIHPRLYPECKEFDMLSKFSKDFLDDLESLRNQTGIYELYNKNKELIYVGKSYNLCKRLFTSSKGKPAYYYSYTTLKSKADVDVYELYYIEKYKPSFNSDCKTDDELTITLPDLKFTFLKPLYKEGAFDE